MSRIGKKPVAVPKGVTANVEGQTVTAKGPKGQLAVVLVDHVAAQLTDEGISVQPRDESQTARAMWGMSRTLVQNIVTGVADGFEKRLDGTFGEGERWVEVAPPGAATTIALVRLPERGPGGIEVSLATQDADADHAALRARGVEADAEVMRMGDFVPPMFTFRDPDGNRFRMVERD